MILLPVLFLGLITSIGANEYETNAEARRTIVDGPPQVVPFYLLGCLGYWVPDAIMREIRYDLEVCALQEEKHGNTLEDLNTCKKYSQAQEGYTTDIEKQLQTSKHTQTVLWVGIGVTSLAAIMSITVATLRGDH